MAQWSPPPVGSSTLTGIHLEQDVKVKTAVRMRPDDRFDGGYPSASRQLAPPF